MAPAEPVSVDHWVSSEHRARYCNLKGEVVNQINWKKFRNYLIKKKPGFSVRQIEDAVERMEWQSSSGGSETERPLPAASAPAVADALEHWVHEAFTAYAFDDEGLFMGWSNFANLLISVSPNEERTIRATIFKLRIPGGKYSLTDPEEIQAARSAKCKQREHAKVQQAHFSPAKPLPQKTANKEPADHPQHQLKEVHFSQAKPLPQKTANKEPPDHPQHQLKEVHFSQANPLPQKTAGTELTEHPQHQHTWVAPQQLQRDKSSMVALQLPSEQESHIECLWQKLHSEHQEEEEEMQIEDLWQRLHDEPHDRKSVTNEPPHPVYAVPCESGHSSTTPTSSFSSVSNSLQVEFKAGSGPPQSINSTADNPHPTRMLASNTAARAPLMARSTNSNISTAPSSITLPPSSARKVTDDLLARLMKRTTVFENSHTKSVSTASRNGYGDDINRLSALNSPFMDFLLPGSKEDDDRHTSAPEITLSPLISGDVVDENVHMLPQYALLGAYVETGSRVFQNTNVPFASFICGVQGSGKSHTTSCMLENAVIPSFSPEFGRLARPLSAMVFAYDEFNGDGTGFNISEAASLASPHPGLPGQLRAQKITVLVSPSNPVIGRIYGRLPNVTVIPFKLDPRKLTVDTILTLMAVDESSHVPLYLAQLTKILREMNVQFNGRFNYTAFKSRLKLCKFNPVQKNMLQLRLDLLESFLDLKGNAPQPRFTPGEITIMDMSCPFVDANTACILFRIGLDRYLESDVAGKMVVLDEAHKYMLNVPGAKALNQELIKTIRLQRHKGVRTIIATQEPTLLTDLIALCDAVVIHRFSSPEWFNALKRHIPMEDQNRAVILDDIESLEPGAALVYCPKAILGCVDGRLIKGTGKLVKLKVRNRITSDGGQSVLAV